MFKENFIKLCNQKNESPSHVCYQVGIKPATFSCWTETSVPRRATLMKIADYFNVTVDELLQDPSERADRVHNELPDNTPQEKKPVHVDEPIFTLSDHEIELIKAYRAQPEVQYAIDKLLTLDGEYIELFVAAHSIEGKIPPKKIFFEKLYTSLYICKFSKTLNCMRDVMSNIM